MNASSVLVELPADPGAVRIARQFVNEHGAGLPPEVVEDAELLVSELVTNAVRHGRPAISLRVWLDPPGIGVEVHDQGPGAPELASAEPSSHQRSGRGLRLVAAVASSWGVRRAGDGSGKAVWFTLRPQA